MEACKMRKDATLSICVTVISMWSCWSITATSRTVCVCMYSIHIWSWLISAELVSSVISLMLWVHVANQKHGCHCEVTHWVAVSTWEGWDPQEPCNEWWVCLSTVCTCFRTLPLCLPTFFFSLSLSDCLYFLCIIFHLCLPYCLAYIISYIVSYICLEIPRRFSQSHDYVQGSH